MAGDEHSLHTSGFTSGFTSGSYDASLLNQVLFLAEGGWEVSIRLRVYFRLFDRYFRGLFESLLQMN